MQPCSLKILWSETWLYIYLSSFTASSDKPKATDQPLGKKIREKDFDAIPVYCAALGAVVVGLLAYVIFKQYSRIRDKKRHKIHDPHEHVEYSRASGINDSGVFVESATCKYYIKEGLLNGQTYLLVFMSKWTKQSSVFVKI